MRVSSTFIRSDRYDLGPFLVGHIIDSQGVLVVTIADLAASISLVRTLVDQTLSVVNVSVLTGTSSLSWVSRVGDVQEDQTTTALGCSWSGADDVNEVRVIVGQDVVSTSIWEATEETGQVSSWIECHWTVLVVQRQELVKVKDLHMVIECLGGDDQVVLVCTDLAPSAGWCASGLWEAADIAELTSIGDLKFSASSEENGCSTNLSERNTITLSDQSKLPSVFCNPSPGRRRKIGSLRAKFPVGDEVVQVDILASVEFGRLVSDRDRLSVTALSKVLFRIWVNLSSQTSICFSSRLSLNGKLLVLFRPLSELDVHQSVVHQARFVELGMAFWVSWNLFGECQTGESEKACCVLHVGQ